MSEFKPNHWPVIEGDEFLLNLGDQWLYQPLAGDENNPHYGTSTVVTWSDSSVRSALPRIIAWVDYWRGQGKQAYAAHLGTGSILWLDFDDRPSREHANYGEGQTLETAQSAYDCLLADCLETTYTEQSRSPGRFHAAFRLPNDHGLPFRQIKGLHGIDLLIGNGWVRMTGCSNGLPIAAIPANLLAQLQGIASSYSFDGVPISEVEGDSELCALPLEEAIGETRRRMVQSSSKTSAGFNYRELIEGPAGLDEVNLSESRAALIQWAAKITCGHRDQHEIVWRIVSESYLAEQTPAISKQNQRRFTSPSKVNYDRFNLRGEYHKLIGLANREVEEAKREADAQRERMAGIYIARAGKRIEIDDDFPRIELPDFPVPIYRGYRDWLLTSVAETDLQLANVATLSHMGAMLGNRVVGPSLAFANLYIIATATAGFGKEVLSGGAMSQVVGDRVKIIGEPRSDSGLYRKLGEGPCNGSGFLLQDEMGPWFEALTRSTSAWQRGILDLMKKIYGVSQFGPRKMLTGQELTKADKDREPIANPALSFLGMGTEEETFQGLAAHGVTDGLLGRVFFAQGDGKPSFNRKPAEAVDPKLLEAMQSRFACINPPNNLPQPHFHVGFTTEELDNEFFEWRQEVSLWRRANAGKKAQLLRSLCENTIRMATAMAFWNGTPITREILDWSRMACENSTAIALEHLRNGNLDSDTIALAARIEELIRRYFEKGKCTNPARARMAIAKGYFTLAYLPDYDSITTRAGKIDSKDPKRAIRAALGLLELSRKIEPVKDAKGQQIDGRWARGDAFD